MLEAHPLTPLLSLHHMGHVHLPQGATLLDVRGAIRRNPFGALQQSVCIANAGLFSISSGLSVRWWPRQTFISLLDLMYRHSNTSCHLTRWHGSLTQLIWPNGGSDTLQTIYTSSADARGDSPIISTISVEEPVSSKRWRGAHRLNCLAVKEGLQDRTIHTLLSDT